MNWRLALTTGVFAAAIAWAARAAAPLRCDGMDSRGRPLLSQANASNQVARLQGSADLATWTELARVHGAFAGFPDQTAEGQNHRFYRTQLTPKTAADDWKNHAVYPADPLQSAEPGWGRYEPRWLKFALVLAEPGKLYFQDSTKYLFHYDFAVARLPRFSGMSRAAFDAVSLRRPNQQVVLGAVLFAPGPEVTELAIQFVGLDPYPREDVARWFGQVTDVIQAPPGTRRFYFPTYEQQAVAQANVEFFAAQNIAVGSAARWISADECYAPGWALGRLVFVPVAELDAAYASGQLGPGDILLIDTVPAEIPPIAGVIALSPATPNSHVAILAQSFGIPFGYFATEDDRTQLRSWDGQEVVVRIEDDYWGCRLKVVSLESQLSPEQRAALLALKALPTLDLPARQPAGQISFPVDGLRPTDIRFVGGKAANLGVLRRVVPANSPSPAIAFTFDLWDVYLAQLMPGGQTLGESITTQLAAFTWPPDMARLRSALAEVREWIIDGTDFDPGQRQAVLTALADAGFEGNRKIRFRSSTNVEDSDQFSGAGLYDSYSGCLADDLDGDTQGPSLCDPDEGRERGVFRALRKVYASFYNDNAFLERLRHGVDESKVGMAVLVHYSTPDEFELANGVATVSVSKSQPGSRSLAMRLVTQAGAVSVANPEVNAVPELVLADRWGPDPAWLRFERASSLVPLGDKVMTWERDYQQLAGFLDRAAAGWEAEFPSRKEFLLDFEYKQVAPGGALRVKQIREVPRPPAGGPVTPWLLNETNHWVVNQGEHGSVFANHRLKSTWILRTGNFLLAGTNLTRTPLRRVEATLLSGLELTNRAGLITEFPEYSHTRDSGAAVDRWTWGAGDTRQRLELHSLISSELPAGRSPVTFLGDGTVQLSLTHAHPQLTIDWNGPTKTLTDTVILTPRQAVSARSLRQSRVITRKGITVETSFFWPPNPTGPSAGYTAPVQAWIETRITGLASQPIRLVSDYAQTYQPGHHNFWENFIFDPHLDPEVSAAVRDELRARNIRGVVATYADTSTLELWGFDDTLRAP